jgi:hypothetical protein
MMRHLIGLLILLFPAEFRERFGADLMATFDDRWSARPGLRTAVRTLFDLTRSAALEQAAAWQRHKSIH